MNVSQLLKHGYSSRDLPFLSPLVKHRLKLKKNAVNKRNNESSHRLKKGLTSSFGTINSK